MKALKSSGAAAKLVSKSLNACHVKGQHKAAQRRACKAAARSSKARRVRFWFEFGRVRIRRSADPARLTGSSASITMSPQVLSDSQSGAGLFGSPEESSRIGPVSSIRHSACPRRSKAGWGMGFRVGVGGGGAGVEARGLRGGNWVGWEWRWGLGLGLW